MAFLQSKPHFRCIVPHLIILQVTFVLFSTWAHNAVGLLSHSLMIFHHARRRMATVCLVHLPYNFLSDYIHFCWISGNHQDLLILGGIRKRILAVIQLNCCPSCSTKNSRRWSWGRISVPFNSLIAFSEFECCHFLIPEAHLIFLLFSFHGCRQWSIRILVNGGPRGMRISLCGASGGQVRKLSTELMKVRKH